MKFKEAQKAIANTSKTAKKAAININKVAENIKKASTALKRK